ncbi:MAG: LAGLIDADG family homing endonuclease [Nanoarchaeota archaeon]
MIPDTVRAYVAGLFDGEGCLYFPTKFWGYLLDASITNTNLNCLLFVQSLYGGSIQAKNNHNVKCYGLHIRKKETLKHFIEDIYSYSIVKKEILQKGANILGISPLIKQHSINTIKAYVAGLIDGEGTITVHHHGRKIGQKSQYLPFICIGNTNKQCLEFVQKYYYGHITTRKKRQDRKIAYDWNIEGYKRTNRLLNDILPFLQIKKRQAQLLIEYQIFNRTTSELTEEKRQFINSIRSLNFHPTLL